MALVDNLVKETTTSTGTGDITLDVSPGGYQAFYDSFGSGTDPDIFFYYIINLDVKEFEVGTGHLSDSTTLVRDTVLQSSNANNLVDFSAGFKNVVCDMPASYQQILTGPIGTPAGSDRQVQFNNSGVFGASPYFTFEEVPGTRRTLNVSSDVGSFEEGEITLNDLKITSDNFVDNQAQFFVSGQSMMIMDASENNVSFQQPIWDMQFGSTSILPMNRQLIATDGSSVSLDWSDGNINFDGLLVHAGNPYALDDLADCITNYSGQYNVFLGRNAGQNVTSGVRNTAVGFDSSGLAVSGDRNISMGVEALYSNAEGSDNIGIGDLALNNSFDGFNNIAIGSSSLINSPDCNYNIGIGTNALTNIAGGDDNNIGIGDNTTATGQSVAIGSGAGAGAGSVSIGFESFVEGDTGVSIGYQADCEGEFNVGIGYQADCGGDGDIAIGYQAGAGFGYSVAMGYQAHSRNGTVAIGPFANATDQSIAIGSNALALDGGDSNTAIGYYSLMSNGSGSRNLAIGPNSLSANTEGSDNLAIGSGTLGVAQNSRYNLAIGNQALANLENGGPESDCNTAVGYQSMLHNNYCQNNTALGYHSLLNLEVEDDQNFGLENTAVGYQSLISCTTGRRNTAIGANSLGTNYTDVDQNNPSGSDNVAGGHSALLANLIGNENTALGSFSLASATADGNTAVGYQAGYAGSAITSGTNNTFLGFQAQSNSATASNRTAVGNAAIATADNMVQLGNSSVTLTKTFGDMSSRHLIGNTSAPTIAAGTGAGTSPTVSISGTDMAGTVSVTTGTLPAGTNATVATITFNKTYGAAPRVHITPGNALTAVLSGVTMAYVDDASTTTTTFVIKGGTTGLTAATAYKWIFHVIQ